MCAHPPVYKWGWGHTLHFYLDKYTVKILFHVYARASTTSRKREVVKKEQVKPVTDSYPINV